MIMKNYRVVVAPHERALRFRDRGVDEVLGPGVHWTLPGALFGHSAIEVHDVEDIAFRHEHIDTLVATRPALVAEHFDVVETGATEVGVVRVGGRVRTLQRPGTRALYWKRPLDVSVQIVDVAADVVVPPELVRAFAARGGDRDLTFAVMKGTRSVEVHEGQVGLLHVDGVMSGVVGPGVHMYWTFVRHVELVVSDTRLTLVEVTGQDILTRDKVSIRVNLSAAYRISDPVRAGATVVKIGEYAYRELQFALRRAVAARSLDELLADKSALDGVIGDDVRARLGEVGITLGSVGVRDIILPGDMRDILNEVVAAEKSAQANNIRRREETAATRSLMNTAKLMEQNPVLVRLKELETLEKVTSRIDRLTVFGGLDGVMREMVKIET